MVATEVDARGLPCPQPVIKTKKALESIPSGIVIIKVDNIVARDNVLKYAKSMAFEASVEQNEHDYSISIIKADPMSTEEVYFDTHDMVVFIDSPFLGSGSDELGALLMKNFLFALSETSPLPQKIILMNGGVHLAAEGSECLPYLCKMADSGVSIESCGICLEYYHLKDKLAIGTITNMYSVVESLCAAKKILKI